MRKQYHARPVNGDTWIWDVHHLVRAARDLPAVEIALTEIAEIDERWWYQDPTDAPTPRSIAEHMRLAAAVDLSHPILLCAEGRLMDGMHRIVRALVEGRATILAIRFPVTPPPDFVNVPLASLPYPDAPI